MNVRVNTKVRFNDNMEIENNDVAGHNHRSKHNLIWTLRKDFDL